MINLFPLFNSIDGVKNHFLQLFSRDSVMSRWCMTCRTSSWRSSCAKWNLCCWGSNRRDGRVSGEQNERNGTEGKSGRHRDEQQQLYCRRALKRIQTSSGDLVLSLETSTHIRVENWTERRTIFKKEEKRKRNEKK